LFPDVIVSKVSAFSSIKAKVRRVLTVASWLYKIACNKNIAMGKNCPPPSIYTVVAFQG
jgi:hypothetical protein